MSEKKEGANGANGANVTKRYSHKKTGKAVVVKAPNKEHTKARTGGKPKRSKTEKLRVPVELLRAALCCASTDETRFMLNCVLLRAKKDRAEVIGTDGHRLFVGAFPLPKGAPSWLKDGVAMSIKELKARLTMLLRTASYDNFSSVVVPKDITVEHASGTSFVMLSDEGREIMIRQPRVDGEFPGIDKILGNIGEAFSGDRPDLEPVAFNAEYLRECSDVAKILGGGPEVNRVDFYMSHTGGPTVVTFDRPGSVLLLMPIEPEATMNGKTVAVIDKAIKGTVAALKSHRTRLKQDLKTAKSASEKTYLDERIADYDKRIDAVMIRAGTKALPKPKEPAKIEGPKTDAAKPDQPAATPPATKPAETQQAA